MGWGRREGDKRTGRDDRHVWASGSGICVTGGQGRGGSRYRGSLIYRAVGLFYGLDGYWKERDARASGAYYLLFGAGGGDVFGLLVVEIFVR